MGKYIVTCIDLLGVKDACKDQSKTNALLSCLRKFKDKDQKSEFSLEEEGFKISPGIFLGFDTIAIYYNLDEIKNLHAYQKIYFCLNHLKSLIGSFAAHAIKHEFLIRGGVDYGDFYQEGDIFLGQAWSNAHELESKIASYPRILLSYNIINEMPDDTDHGKTRPGVIKQDHDGLYYLPYILHMMEELKRLRNDIENFNEIEQCIEKNIKNAEKNAEYSSVSKWSSFRNYVQEEKRRRVGPD